MSAPNLQTQRHSIGSARGGRANRIAVAGFQHETNTFGTTLATRAEFEIADAWPPLLRGNDVVSGTAGINLPIAGFVDAAMQDGSAQIVPVAWASAEPSSYVTDDAFDWMAGMIIDGIGQAGDIDAIYLDLHGAMVTESHEDGEGELLARIKSSPAGQDVPIAVSLDLHANITERMLELASSLSVFRTYPHLDMDDTGARAWDMLRRLLGGEQLFKVVRQVPFLIPLSAQHTGSSPCRELYGLLPPTGKVTADIAMGFPLADIRDAGATVVAHAPSQEKAGHEADRILDAIIAAESEFNAGLVPATAAVREAMQHSGTKPVVIADVQDNPGAGAASDSTGLLAALVQEGAQGAILGLLNDPEAAVAAHTTGIGAEFAADLGGKCGAPGISPFVGHFRVESLSQGSFPFAGEMYRGSVAEIGPTALLRVLDTDSDVRVAVGSRRCQCLDRAIFTHLGINPEACRIVAVKSTVHFRADFDPIAEKIINAEAPGTSPCRHEGLPYQRLRPGVRLSPCGHAGAKP